jgi:hypothetical protein
MTSASDEMPISPSSTTTAAFTAMPVDMPSHGSSRSTGSRGGHRHLVFGPIEATKVFEPRSYVLSAESVVCLLVCLPRRTRKAPGGRDRWAKDVKLLQVVFPGLLSDCLAFSSENAGFLRRMGMATPSNGTLENLTFFRSGR